MSRWFTLVSALALISLFVGFVLVRLLTPSDGARLQPGADILDAGGLVVTPLKETGELEPGDVVLAVEGYPLEVWAADLLNGDLPRPEWEFGTKADYTVRRAGEPVQVEPLLGPYPVWEVLRSDWGALTFAVANVLVALFAFSRKPDDTAVRVLLLGSASLLAASTWSIGLQISDFIFAPAFLLYQLTTIVAFSLVWACVLHFVLIFPRPQPWLAGRRWVFHLLYVLALLMNAVWLVYSRLTTTSTLAWLAGFGEATGVVQILYVVLILLGAVGALRYARDPVSRAQMRWVLFALVAALAFGLVFSDIPDLLLGRPILSTNAVSVFGLIVPISIVIAIFRFGLFNIDVIIRRTTQYAILTAVLAIIYFASVVALQWVFTSLTGQTSSLAVVLSTLLIAALFLPLRQRVQDAIDRRFFRQKYDAQKTLEEFAATVRDETDLDELTAELVRVIQETMQPEHITVWLRPIEDLESELDKTTG